MATAVQNSCDLCEICQRVFEAVEKMFREGISEADGEFNTIPVWKFNGMITKSCRLCLLLLHNANKDRLSESGDSRENILCKLILVTRTERAVIRISILTTTGERLAHADVISRLWEARKLGP
jgi:hypothetical protein